MYVKHAIIKTCFLPGLILFLLIAGCSSNVIHRREDVSRDYTYIYLPHKEKPFLVRDIVGGEHMSYFTVLGFEGDIYLVELDSLEGSVLLGISGDGIKYLSGGDDLPGTWAVRVVDRETLFSIDLSAHPFGEYLLKITRVDGRNTGHD